LGLAPSCRIHHYEVPMTTAPEVASPMTSGM
jgi:hypothetical protein